MRTMILAIFAAFSLGIATANAQSQEYHAPAYNYHQNNWGD